MTCMLTLFVSIVNIKELFDEEVAEDGLLVQERARGEVWSMPSTTKCMMMLIQVEKVLQVSHNRCHVDGSP